MYKTGRLLTGVITGVAFLMLAAAVSAGRSDFIDHLFRNWALSQNSELGVEIWKQITHLGSVSFLTALTVFWCALLLVLGKRGASLWLVLTAIGATLLDVAEKQLLHRPRPDEIYPGTLPESFSFPSGHAFFSLVLYFSIFSTLGTLFRSAPRYLFSAVPLFIAAVVGTSRLFLGVHYPTDVLGGYLLAVTWLCVMLEAKDGLIQVLQPRIDRID